MVWLTRLHPARCATTFNCPEFLAIQLFDITPDRFCTIATGNFIGGEQKEKQSGSKFLRCTSATLRI